jgi:hypothetical protein
MEDHLHVFENQIMDQIKNISDIIDQAALLWKILHYVIIKFKERNKNWIFLLYKDIARQPEKEFVDLFQHLGLSVSDHNLKAIKAKSSDTNPVYSSNPYSIHRSSSRLVADWKNKLTEKEITRIRKTVEDISYEFYDDEDW